LLFLFLLCSLAVVDDVVEVFVASLVVVDIFVALAIAAFVDAALIPTYDYTYVAIFGFKSCS
jgi:hypothetical protein